jgi:alpha-1,3-rhamnosyl/mannosyltransferase
MPYMDLDALAELMARSRALLFLSRYEAFGIPAAEAMAAGVPVVASNFSGLPEVAGNAGLIMDAADSANIADVLKRLCDDQEFYEKYRRLGLERARLFRWSDCARRVTQALDIA